MTAFVGAWTPGGASALRERLRAATDRLRHHGRAVARVGPAAGLEVLVVGDGADPGRAGWAPAGGPEDTPESRVIALAGRLENADEIRTLAGAPATAGDAELVSRHWAAAGARGLAALRGALAGVGAARHRPELVLFRDAYGVAPLYYCRWRGAVLFASEIRALLALGVPRKVNADRVPDFFHYGVLVGGQTLLDGIYAVPAGALVRFPPESAGMVETYHELPIPRPERHTVADWADLAWQTLRSVVERQARVHRRPAVLLSGGVDSAIVAAALRGTRTTPCASLTGGYTDADLDERPAAARIAARLGLPHRGAEPEVGGPSLLERCARLLWQHEQPSRFINAVSAQALLEAAAGEDLDVLFAGDEADTTYGGWAHVVADRIERLARLPRPLRLALAPASRLAAGLPGIGSRAQTLAELLPSHGMDPALYLAPFCSAGFTRRLTGADGAFTAEVVRSTVRRYTPAPLETLYSQVHLVLSGPVMAERIGKVAAHHGLAMAFPFMDDAMVALAFRMPAAARLAGRTTKPVLREVFVRHLGADLLPPRKIGWDPPSDRWMESEPSLRDGLRILLEPRARERGIIDAEAVAARVAGRPLRGTERGGAEELWGPLALEIWCRTFIDGDGAAPWGRQGAARS
ncbi:MAG: asparagine synthase-related protein [Candidatus Rokubacteria bacterium]|nr:asparagine synthase-related protein [Candidatus Rokubacteria bacterium]